GLTRLVAPILTFTADEVWQHLPAVAGREESVHMALFPTREALEALEDDELLERWGRLLAVRERVLAEIEPLRKAKRIGSSLQARVVLTAPDADYALLERHGADLPMLFIVSDVELRRGDQSAPLQIAIDRAHGVRCERCWRYVSRVSSDPAWAGLCERCQEQLAEPVDQPGAGRP